MNFQFSKMAISLAFLKSGKNIKQKPLRFTYHIMKEKSGFEQNLPLYYETEFVEKSRGAGRGVFIGCSEIGRENQE